MRFPSDPIDFHHLTLSYNDIKISIDIGNGPAIGAGRWAVSINCWSIRERQFRRGQSQPENAEAAATPLATSYLQTLPFRPVSVPTFP